MCECACVCVSFKIVVANLLNFCISFRLILGFRSFISLAIRRFMFTNPLAEDNMRSVVRTQQNTKRAACRVFHVFILMLMMQMVFQFFLLFVFDLICLFGYWRWHILFHLVWLFPVWYNCFAANKLCFTASHSHSHVTPISHQHHHSIVHSFGIWFTNWIENHY